jgi:septal ring factor EnvC (AmiA/AmiB activator)
MAKTIIDPGGTVQLEQLLQMIVDYRAAVDRAQAMQDRMDALKDQIEVLEQEVFDITGQRDHELNTAKQLQKDLKAVL